MKKKTKAIVIVGSIIGVICITLLVTGLISIQPFNYFAKDYSQFLVYDFGASSAQPHNPDWDKKLEEGFKQTKYSVLHSFFEGEFGYAPRVLKDDDKEIIYRTSSEILDMSAPTNRYLIIFKYDSVHTITVGKQKIEYDEVMYFIPQGNSEITDVRVIAYDSSRITGQGEGTEAPEYYRTPELRLKMLPTKLYNVIAGVIEEIKE